MILDKNNTLFKFVLIDYLLVLVDKIRLITAFAVTFLKASNA